MHESDLAWELAEHTRQLLAETDCVPVFVHLGAGDHHLAIREMLEVLVRERIRLSSELTAQLQSWAEIYDAEPTVRTLLLRASSAYTTE
jgi:hypothetical protein